MPDSLLRRFNDVPKIWTIYTQAEADEKGLEYKPWRECKVGDWALTDDAYVCQIVKVMGPYRESDSRGYARYQFTVPFTRQWMTKAPLNYGDFVRHGMRPWLAEELNRPRWKRALLLYCELLIEHGFPLPQKHIDVVGYMYRPDQEIPAASFKRILKHNEAKAMMADQLRRILSKQGYTPEKILSMYGEAFEAAAESGQASAMRAVAKDLADMADMKPNAADPKSASIERADFTLLEVEDATVVKEIPPHRLTV